MLVPSDTLAKDAIDMSEGDLAGLGPQQVVSKRIVVTEPGENLSVALFQPAHFPEHACPRHCFPARPDGI